MSTQLDTALGKSIRALTVQKAIKPRRNPRIEALRARAEKNITVIMRRVFAAQAESVVRAVERSVSDGLKKYDESEPRDESGKWTDEDSGTDLRAERAKASCIPVTQEKRQLATAMEKKVASSVGGKQQPDNAAFDVLHEKNAFEVKTIMDGKNPKITMHGESLARKVAFAKTNKVKSWTVAVDSRGTTPQIYVRRGVGSFRLSAMDKVGGWEGLREKFA